MKNCILQVSAELIAKTPIEIESSDQDENIRCVGWYRAHKFNSPAGVDNTILLACEICAGQDKKYYVTQWEDASSDGIGNQTNHLWDKKNYDEEESGSGASGQTDRDGPVPYGGEQQDQTNVTSSGTNADLVNGYTPLQFYKEQADTGHQQKWLLVNPAVNNDFGISTSNTRPCFSWMAVMRHHGGDSYGNLPMTNNDYMDIWGFYEKSIHDTNTMRMSIHYSNITGYRHYWHSSGNGSSNGTVAFNTTNWTSASRDTNNSNGYQVVGGFCTSQTTPSTGNGFYSQMMGNHSVGTESTQQQLVSCGCAATNSIDAMSIGLDTSATCVNCATSPSIAEHNLDGRILEMAFWKSDIPISDTDRQSVHLYMTNKFNL